MIGYIMKKSELTLLLILVNKENARLAEKFFRETDYSQQKRLVDGLEKKGYVFRRGNAVDVEKSIAFLLRQFGNADEAAISADGLRYVYYCPLLVLMLEQDRLNKDNCRLVPFENENSLLEYLEENEIFLGTKVNIREVNNFGKGIEC